jgi:hypothetical protein
MEEQNALVAQRKLRLATQIHVQVFHFILKIEMLVQNWSSFTNFFSYFVVDCSWSSWDEWTSCSKTCDGGIRRSKRTVSVELSHGGMECEGTSTRIEVCNRHNCRGNVGVSTHCLEYPWKVCVAILIRSGNFFFKCYFMYEWNCSPF